MNDQQEHWEEAEFYGSLPCQFCDDGLLLVCPDDICRGNGGCHMVRAGCYIRCPHCDGCGQRRVQFCI